MPDAEAFPLATAGGVALIAHSEDDFEVVGIAAMHLADDVERVVGRRPPVAVGAERAEAVVYIGTLGRSSLVDRLVAERLVDVSDLQDAWESFVIVSLEDPEPGVKRGLAIIGSDRRGTAYGVYELSQAIGVSPWYWWADVAPRQSEELYVRARIRRFGPPSVKYRGIFINDEDWGLHPWASQTFDPETGDIGPKTYERVFELMLRLKANTLWPAMHEVTQAFNLYPENKTLADRYAIVMASSHAEPLLRNNVTEWTAPKSEYNYHTNRSGVLRYWEQRLEENARFENVYTLGMRGIHDSGITAGGSTQEKVELLSGIIADQRELLGKHVNPDVEAVPQVFTPYKEVLELYQAGLEVPEDVTLVWPDDNHGFIRRFPNESERARRGGSGVYYHLSYLGSPLAYLWLHTTPPALVWEEMTKAYALGAREYWIVNVGDIKPGELGMEFFLQMAWDIDRWNLDTLPNFIEEWASREFGEANGGSIAAALESYFELNYHRRPEHLQWWLPHHRAVSSPLTAGETRERLASFDAMLSASEGVKGGLPAALHDAYFQLVEYPVKASTFANRRYFHAEQYDRLFNADPSAARMHGALSRRADADLSALTSYYNEELSGGKWRRMMAEEPADNLWRSYRLSPPILPAANMVAKIESDQELAADLPFRGASEEAATLAEVEREAESFDDSGAVETAEWRVIPGLGRTGDSIASMPFAHESFANRELEEEVPWVAYEFEVSRSGEYTLYANLIPTFPLAEADGLRLGISIDGEPPRVVSLVRETGDPAWKRAVLSGVATFSATVNNASPDRHTLRLYAVDAGVVVDKWFLHQGELSQRFLGPQL